jgi:hypothetical protein
MATFHIVHAEPCEHALRFRLQQIARAGYVAPDAAFSVKDVKAAVEQLERYRSVIAELKNRYEQPTDPWPSTQPTSSDFSAASTTGESASPESSSKPKTEDSPSQGTSKTSKSSSEVSPAAR